MDSRDGNQYRVHDQSDGDHIADVSDGLGRAARSDFSACSSYRDEYRPQKLTGYEAVPAAKPRLSLPFAGVPISRDYRAYPPAVRPASSLAQRRASPIPNHVNPHSQDQAADWRSTHHDEYRFKEVVRPQTAVRHHTRMVLPFTAQTTSRAEFRPPPPASFSQFRTQPRPQLEQDAHIDQLISHGVFDGRTSYSKDFAPIPTGAYPSRWVGTFDTDDPSPPLPFEGTTETRENYHPRDAPAPERRPITTIDQGQYAISDRSSVFDCISESRANFVRHEQDAGRAPASGADPFEDADPVIPFQGTSESRASYQAHPPSHRAPAPSAVDQPGPEFEGNSTSRSDYPPCALPNNRVPGPAPQAGQLDRDDPQTKLLPFDGTSESRANYVQFELPDWNNDRMMYSKYERVPLPFNAESTSRSDYKPYPAEADAVPGAGRLSGVAPAVGTPLRFEGISSYQHDFVELALERSDHAARSTTPSDRTPIRFDAITETMASYGGGRDHDGSRRIKSRQIVKDGPQKASYPLPIQSICKQD